MYGFPHPQEYYNNSDYNNPLYDSTSYGHPPENYCTYEQPSAYNYSENNYYPHEFTSNSYGHLPENFCTYENPSYNNYHPYESTPNSYGYPPENYCTSTQPSSYNHFESENRQCKLTVSDKGFYSKRFIDDFPQEEPENYGELLVQTSNRLWEQRKSNICPTLIGNYQNFEDEDSDDESEYADKPRYNPSENCCTKAQPLHFNHAEHDDGPRKRTLLDLYIEQGTKPRFMPQEEWEERIRNRIPTVNEPMKNSTLNNVGNYQNSAVEDFEDEPTPAIEDFPITTFDDDVCEVVSDTEKELDFDFIKAVHVDLKFDLPITNEPEETVRNEEVANDFLKKDDFDENIFFGITEDSEDEPTIDTIEDFQVTTSESKEEYFYDTGQDTMHELDFNLVENLSIDLEFNLPVSDELKTAVLDFQHEETLRDAAEEDKLDEHAFFGIFNDDGEEANISCQPEQFELIDFEEQLGDSDGESNNTEGCDHKLGFEIFDKVETSIQLHVSTNICSF